MTPEDYAPYVRRMLDHFANTVRRIVDETEQTETGACAAVESIRRSLSSLSVGIGQNAPDPEWVVQRRNQLGG